MNQIIKVKPNKDGKVIIKLYGKEFDVTNRADSAGLGKLEAFGEVYQFEIVRNDKNSKKEQLWTTKILLKR